MNKLSVITICFNEVETIEKTLQSVFEQQFNDYEYIVIDGGSTDGTVDIIKKYSDNITRIISEPDLGIANAHNKGIQLSQGEYLCFLNGGDYLCNNYIFQRIFSDELKADIIYGDIIFILKNGLKYRKKSPKSIKKNYMLIDCIPHPGTLIRKKLFNRIGNFDESYKIAADYDFFLRAIFDYKCNLKYMPFPFVVFNLQGISSLPIEKNNSNNERKKAQEKYLYQSHSTIFFLLKPFYIFFGKKLRYLYYFIMSQLSKSFLKES